ncbi:Di-copper centre-containing protein [Coprinellus micaceus]|uniref:Di-copper centre-containing protein n=1 Tax=Coprinellus micaceus TaxID=71717 RepID=A0A4Y7SKW8_COPMI|nr:Di-copper centre-containing protein [Coprinellus micaceus]
MRALGTLSFLFLLWSAVAVPVHEPSVGALEVPGTKCSIIDNRREWRDLTTEQRLKYINAVKCLHKLPPKDKTRAATTRFEEFQATHILLTDRVHLVGHFLPWHRHLGTLYGRALQEECGYDGPTTYWDWTRDDMSLPLLNSPIFDSATGFGGDGVEGTYTLPSDPNNQTGIFPFPGQQASKIWKGCVQDGPFKDWVVHLGPGRMNTAHCLVRGVNEFMRSAYTAASVENVLSSNSFESFRLIIDRLPGVHGGGHAMVGGEMTNTYSAGADPLFYLHHGGLDRLWWKWQQADPTNRLYAISGPTTQRGRDNVTLDFEIDFPALGPNITVRDTMDSSLYPNCFTYE